MAAYEKIEAPRGEWSDPIAPVMRGYKLACCDCGLVHDIDFTATRIGKKRADGSQRETNLDHEKYGVLFRVRRNNRSTAMLRRWAILKTGRKPKKKGNAK